MHDKLQRWSADEITVLCFLIQGAIEKLIMMDTSYDMIKLCKESEQRVGDESTEISYVVADEEFLPIKERFKPKLMLLTSIFLCIRTLLNLSERLYL